MQSLLHKVNQLVHEEKILKREKERRGENYNIFEVMHAQGDEVNTHSAIIASLLNPKHNHGCESAFLKIFIHNLDFLKIHLYILRNVFAGVCGSPILCPKSHSRHFKQVIECKLILDVVPALVVFYAI